MFKRTRVVQPSARSLARPDRYPRALQFQQHAPATVDEGQGVAPAQEGAHRGQPQGHARRGQGGTRDREEEKEEEEPQGCGQAQVSIPRSGRPLFFSPSNEPPVTAR